MAIRIDMKRGSCFSNLEVIPPDGVFHVEAAFRADPDPNKSEFGHWCVQRRRWPPMEIAFGN